MKAILTVLLFLGSFQVISGPLVVEGKGHYVTESGNIRSTNIVITVNKNGTINIRYDGSSKRSTTITMRSHDLHSHALKCMKWKDIAEDNNVEKFSKLITEKLLSVKIYQSGSSKIDEGTAKMVPIFNYGYSQDYDGMWLNLGEASTSNPYLKIDAHKVQMNWDMVNSLAKKGDMKSLKKIWDEDIKKKKEKDNLFK